MFNTLKKDMATTFLRHYVKIYMLKKDISGEAEAVEKILKDLPVLAFSNDETEKIGAGFISKNKQLFTVENLYPNDDIKISSFDSLFNVPVFTVEGHAALETTMFVNIFHEGEDLTELCKENEKGLDDNVFRLFPKKISWGNIKDKKFSADFLEENVEKIDWSNVCINQDLTETFMRKYANKLNWYGVSRNQKISEEFMDFFKEKLEWDYICQYQKMSEDFMTEHSDYVDWRRACQFQEMSETFIEKNEDDVNWSKISEHKKLSIAFIEKHFKSVNMGEITQYQDLTESFIEKHFDTFSDQSKVHVFTYQRVSKEFCDRHKSEIKSRRGKYDSTLTTWCDLFINDKLLHFDFKGTIVHKDVDNPDIRSTIACHKGPVMVKAKHSNKYFRSVFVRNKNKYRLISTKTGYKNWDTLTTPLNEKLFELDEVVDVIKRTVCLPEKERIEVKS